MCEMMKKLTKINLEQISFWLLCAIVMLFTVIRWRVESKYDAE